ncbi:MAG: hypothetical protein GIKADHBN_01975 [Phycisphaerales bacterium]|nr:hypothetical protein [Phycisphaerales bacterium]MCK6475695.1 hypothetical protein [Phycisphaerales bacterium]
MPLAQRSSGDMEWVQKSGFQWSFELRQADSVFATLEWRSSFGTLATARTESGSWTFKRVGFWSPRVTVRREGAADDMAVFTPRGWTGASGVLNFPDGTSIILEREGFWSSTWQFRVAPAAGSEQPGPPIVRIGDMAGLFRWRASITVVEPDHPQAPLLACLLWYLVVLASQDAMAATIGAVSAAGTAAS